MTGRVYQINVKPKIPGEHGLPKHSTDSARVSFHGLDGDFNNYREEAMSGDPDQAVLILPLETVGDLNSEGWPVRPGDLGENLTIEGIEYDDFAPGSRYRVGGALIEVSKPCPPCAYLYSLPYVGQDKGPEFLRTMLNRRGWFARVIEEGEVERFGAVTPVL